MLLQTICGQRKRRSAAPFCFAGCAYFAAGLAGALPGFGLLELLALLFSTLLQLFLQLLLVFFEHLRVGRRTIIGLGEFAERQRQRQRRAVGVDRLHHEVLALLHAGEQFGVAS